MCGSLVPENHGQRCSLNLTRPLKLHFCVDGLQRKQHLCVESDSTGVATRKCYSCRKLQNTKTASAGFNNGLQLSCCLLQLSCSTVASANCSQYCCFSQLSCSTAAAATSSWPHNAHAADCMTTICWWLTQPLEL